MNVRSCFKHWLIGLSAVLALALPGSASASGVSPNDNAIWIGDSYQGAPLNELTLYSSQLSDTIYVSFANESGPTWGADVVLAQWNGSDDGPPERGSSFCDRPDFDWKSCDPAVPAWIGYTQVNAGEVGTFAFQIVAPRVESPQTFTLYFRPARQKGPADAEHYFWLDSQSSDGLPNNRTYEVFTVTVIP